MAEMRALSSFDLSFWSGLQGGVIGGAVAAVPVAIGYYWKEPLPLPEVAEVVLYTVLVGAVTGTSAQLGMAVFRWLAQREGWSAWLVNDITGASLACALGGLLMGLVGGQWFGLRERRPIDILLVFAAALLGSAVVLYDTGGRLRRMIRYCLIPLPISGVVAYAGFRLLQIDLYAESDVEAYRDGAKFGLMVGFVMGLQIGLGLFLYRRRTWPRGDSLRKRPASA